MVTLKPCEKAKHSLFYWARPTDFLILSQKGLLISLLMGLQMLSVTVKRWPCATDLHWLCEKAMRSDFLISRPMDCQISTLMDSLISSQMARPI